ncbi:MAG: M20 metallopeptidase family protein, partial [Chloroflexota bacterium]
MPLPNDLRDAANEIGPGVVADRRDIHQHPELAYEEKRTSALVAARLRELGLDVRTGVGGTGVVGLLRGRAAGKTVLLRADMDALPIREENQTPYASRQPGVMHACGHDAHTAILLGVARVLADHRQQILGTVKFMFQPAEEGGAGALRMIEDGVLDAPTVDAAFGLHVDTERYVGQVALRPGLAMASSDRFTITVHGKGGHAASPHRTVDPIVVGAQIVTALQTIVSREVSPN